MKKPNTKYVPTKESALFAANFRRLRKEKGWTQFQTAQQADPAVSLRYIAAIEGDTHNFGKSARVKWAKIFGVDVNEFYKPIELTPWDHEFELLKQEAQNYGYAKIRHFRELMPLLLEREDVKNAPVLNKKKFPADRSPQEKERS